MMTNPSKPAPNRLVSLDALRGFDMFWIMGADALVQALGEVNHSAPARFFAGQLDHKAWSGLAFYDIIFPLFVFIVGVSSVFSLERLKEQYGRNAAIVRVLRRGALLLLLGFLYGGGITNPWPDMRLLGVLPRIAICYTLTGVLFCYFRPKALAGIIVALLAGYWALLAFVPIKDCQLDDTVLASQIGVAKPSAEQVRHIYDSTTAEVRGNFEPGLNLTNHLDYLYLPGRKYDHYWDPEGLLSTLPAIATCLIGVFAGLLMRRGDLEADAKLRTLLIAGAILLAAGWLWHPWFPIVKKIWTSSFVLVAGGWSLLLLGGFHYLIDLRGWRRWCEPFIWIGMNPITLYLFNGIVGFRRLAQRMAGGDLKLWLDAHIGAGAGQGVLALVGLALMFTLARFLYRRQIFLRV